MSLPIVPYVRVQNLLFNRRMLVDWDSVEFQIPPIDGYKVYRSASAYNGFNLITTVSGSSTQYIDVVPITFDVNFYYKVTAYRGSEESDLSATPAVSDVSIEYFETQPFGSALTSNLFILDETPIGIVDNTNKLFNTINSYRPNSLSVYLNGLKLKRGLDFTELGNDQFEFIEAPSNEGSVLDTVTVDYIKR